MKVVPFGKSGDPKGSRKSVVFLDPRFRGDDTDSSFSA